MAVRDDFAPGEVLTASDLNDTFAAKADLDGATYTGSHDFSGASVTGVGIGKNVLINGSFAIWQRGTGTYSTNGYCADRWLYTNGPSATANITLVDWSNIGSLIQGNRNVLSWAMTANGSSASTLEQRIEGAETLAGQIVTFSFYGKAASATTTFNVSLEQNFGSGGSATVQVTSQAVAVTTTASRHSLTFTLPSVTGKTFGSGSYLRLLISRGSTQNTNAVYISNVQLEEGSIATPFEFKPFGQELRECQRYFEKSFPINTAPAHNLGGEPFLPYMGSFGCGGNSYTVVKFAVPKRAVGGTLRLFDPIAAHTFTQNWVTTYASCAATSAQVTALLIIAYENYMSGYVQGAGTGAFMSANWTVECEL